MKPFADWNQCQFSLVKMFSSESRQNKKQQISKYQMCVQACVCFSLTVAAIKQDLYAFPQRVDVLRLSDEGVPFFCERRDVTLKTLRSPAET